MQTRTHLLKGSQMSGRFKQSLIICGYANIFVQARKVSHKHVLQRHSQRTVFYLILFFLPYTPTGIQPKMGRELTTFDVNGKHFISYSTKPVG